MARPREKLHDLHFTVVAEDECPDCGAKVEVKVNQNMCLYTVCTNIIRKTEKGKKIRCSYRRLWGADKSAEIIAAYEAGQSTEEEQGDENQPQESEPVRDAETGGGGGETRNGDTSAGDAGDAGGDERSEPGEGAGDDGGGKRGRGLWFT